MTINQLKEFVTIVEIGSINKASKVLYISQPTLSITVSALEKELGVELLQRTRQGVFPTEVGEEFYQFALSVIKEENKFYASKNRITMKELKRIRVFSSYSVSQMKLNKGLSKAFPSVEIEYASFDIETCLRSLKSGICNFSFGDYIEDPEITSILVEQMSCYLFIPDYTLEKNQKFNYKYLDGKTVVVLCDNPFMERRLYQFQKRHNIQIRFVKVFNENDLFDYYSRKDCIVWIKSARKNSFNNLIDIDYTIDIYVSYLTRYKYSLTQVVQYFITMSSKICDSENNQAFE